MSTGLNCSFIEPAPGQWYYVLEHGSAPKNAWDWREHATAYGPFASKDAAHEHLGQNHANPGGYCIVANAQFRMDKVYEQLIKDAENPQHRQHLGFVRMPYMSWRGR